MKRKRAHAALYNNPQAPQFQALIAADPPDAYYCLVTNIEDAAGITTATDQVHVYFDAARVSWYQQLDLTNIPPLDTIALNAWCRIFEFVMRGPAYQQLDAALVQNTGRSLEEYSWWMITPWLRNLRGSVRFESFRPPAGNANPATIVEQGMRHNEFFVRDRLIVPRDALKVILYSMREL